MPEFTLFPSTPRRAMTSTYDHQSAPAIKADLRTELDLRNKNVDEIISLFQGAQDAGIWTQQEAKRHEARFEALRTNEFRQQR